MRRQRCASGRLRRYRSPDNYGRDRHGRGRRCTTKVQGVVALGRGRPVSLETVLVPDPGPGEALVRVQACGVCHTDLHYREGKSQTASRSCWAMRRPAKWSMSGPTCEACARGVRHPQLAGRVRTCRAAARASPSIASPLFNATQPMTLTGRDAVVAGVRDRRIRRSHTGGGRPVHRGTQGPP